MEELISTTNGIIPKTIYSDANPAMSVALQNIWPDTYHSYCIFHMNNNFIKKMKAIIGKNFDECYKLFYRSCNSLFKANFEHRWAQFVEFIEPFPKAT